MKEHETWAVGYTHTGYVVWIGGRKWPAECEQSYTYLFLSASFPGPWQWVPPVLSGRLQEEGAHGSDLPTLRQELLSSVSGMSVAHPGHTGILRHKG